MFSLLCCLHLLHYRLQLLVIGSCQGSDLHFHKSEDQDYAEYAQVQLLCGDLVR